MQNTDIDSQRNTLTDVENILKLINTLIHKNTHVNAHKHTDSETHFNITHIQRNIHIDADEHRLRKVFNDAHKYKDFRSAHNDADRHRCQNTR